MNIFILIIGEDYGEYVYAVFAKTLKEAYFKIKTDKNLALYDCHGESDIETDAYGCSFFTFKALKDVSSKFCTLTELKESDEIIELGGYVE